MGVLAMALSDSSKQDHRFRKREHLRRSGDFADVFAGKASAADGAMVVYVRPNGLGWSRLGIMAGRRIGNAVVRAYVRRRLREAFRHIKDDWKTPVDIICIARAQAASRGIDLRHSMRNLVRKATALFDPHRHRRPARPNRRRVDSKPRRTGREAPS